MKHIAWIAAAMTCLAGSALAQTRGGETKPNAPGQQMKANEPPRSGGASAPAPGTQLNQDRAGQKPPAGGASPYAPPNVSR